MLRSPRSSVERAGGARLIAPGAKLYSRPVPGHETRPGAGLTMLGSCDA